MKIGTQLHSIKSHIYVDAYASVSLLALPEPLLFTLALAFALAFTAAEGRGGADEEAEDGRIPLGSQGVRAIKIQESGYLVFFL